MKPKFFIPLFILLCFIFQNIHAQSDSIYFYIPTKKQIQIISSNNHKECWAIAGNDSTSIFRIDSNFFVTDKTFEFRNHTKAKFSSIITIHENIALIGTKNDFCFFYNNGKITKIDRKYGLNDSCILSISYSKLSDKIYIESLLNGYASIDSSFMYYLQFTQIFDEADMHDSIAKQLTKGNLLRYVYVPIKKFARTFLSGLANKEKSPSKKEKKITRKQITEIRKQLEPGDILFKREEGQFTNHVIPGYWTHIGIYLGNLNTLNKFFKGLPMLNGMKPSKYIFKHYPKIYMKLMKLNYHVIESVTKTGVSINPLKNIAHVDHFGALRPKLSKEDLFLAILKSFDYYQLPYDYDYDISGKDAIICSALIYKAFVPTKLKKGLNFKITSLMGCPFLYPADVVKKFDEEFDSPNAELDFVLFYDSNETQKYAFPSSKTEFRKTYTK